MEKISSTLGAINGGYNDTFVIMIREEIADGLNWDEEESDTLRWTILNDNIVILERNRSCDFESKIVERQVSVKLEIGEVPQLEGLYMIEVPKEIEPDLKWGADDPVDWIILERNTVILQRFEPLKNK
jgi:hypothetical protein